MAKWESGKEKKEDFNQEEVHLKLNGVIAIAILFVALVFVLSLSFTPQPNQPATQLTHFSSYSELVDYFAKAQSSNYGRGYGWEVALPMMATSVGKATGAPNAIASDAGSQATDYSKTNIQVEGVDEADIIKNDGKYIYAIAQNKLFIVNAYPAENAQIIATIDMNNKTPIEMFISDDSTKLLLFANQYNSYGYGYYDAVPMTKTVGGIASMPSIRPWPGYGGSSVSAELYNISNKSSPVLEKTIDFEGSYLSSRLIGSNAYFVINSYPRYYIASADSNGTDTNGIIPLMRVNGAESTIASATEIGVMPYVQPSSFVTIASLNLNNGEMQKQTVTASAQSVYASQNSLYFADNFWSYEDINGPVPLVGAIVKSIYSPYINQVEKTVVNKFTLDNGNISFVGQGIVPGTVLNQFSMDEYNDNFRIATTAGSVFGTGANQSKNNIYILGSDMNIVGSIENLAPGEKIYSARFMGKKAYLVTFKKVDPLFVLDLADPTNPKVLGKLKIPGYSDYLHPIDENHIIGIGKEAIDSGYDTFAWYQGMKMAIFDVSDVANPKEMHKITLGDRGTNSEALSDHKAFLYDKEKQLLVIPINLYEIPADVKNAPQEQAQGSSGTNGASRPIVSMPQYGEQTFQGAMVFNVSLENGFVERGRITHVSAEEELKAGYYYDYSSTIRRSLFMDNVLYTFSDKELKANALDTLDPISEVLFEMPVNCMNYTYSNCPAQCVARCTPSSCSEVGICTSDCDGANSCTKN